MGEKYLQITYMIRDYYSDYIKNTSNNVKPNIPIKEWAKDLNRYLAKDNTQLAYKPMKRCSVILRKDNSNPQWDITSWILEWCYGYLKCLPNARCVEGFIVIGFGESVWITRTGTSPAETLTDGVTVGWYFWEVIETGGQALQRSRSWEHSLGTTSSPQPLLLLFLPPPLSIRHEGHNLAPPCPSHMMLYCPEPTAMRPAHYGRHDTLEIINQDQSFLL